jgi:nucleotide-binding universal stress UspA family protein
MYKKILLAYDGTREGRAAITECDEIAHLLQAEIHLLAVVHMPSALFLSEGVAPASFIEHERQSFQEIVDEGVSILSNCGHAVRGHLAFGEPVREMCRLARELGADLIVLGHRKHTSIATRWWHGSVGMSLVEHAPCSILIVVARG